MRHPAGEPLAQTCNRRDVDHIGAYEVVWGEGSKNRAWRQSLRYPFESAGQAALFAAYRFSWIGVRAVLNVAKGRQTCAVQARDTGSASKRGAGVEQEVARLVSLQQQAWRLRCGWHHGDLER